MRFAKFHKRLKLAIKDDYFSEGIKSGVGFW